MKYENIREGRFIERLNRFTALADAGAGAEKVHVKNTGRLGELLVPGAQVFLTEPGTPGRKTRLDLVTVRREDGKLVNIDSQAPNRIMAEVLARQGLDRVVPEYRYGASRLDFCLWRDGRSCLVEVKGCTLEIGGVGYFPDAPTERGIRHLHELVRARSEGLYAALAFVIPMDGVFEVRPNTRTHPAFAGALSEAREAGVRVVYVPCHAEEDGAEALPLRDTAWFS